MEDQNKSSEPEDYHGNLRYCAASWIVCHQILQLDGLSFFTHIFQLS
jgi:hypothetical protein